LESSIEIPIHRLSWRGCPGPVLVNFSDGKFSLPSKRGGSGGKIHGLICTILKNLSAYPDR
jgi:hypothetical protein